ncbi:hypothetical protein HZU77_013080 [Neisseriaceae bacterium TC5R-5]|nr:hypothetical protein [Neisseriaceae bacterium TC5R-5]
MKVNQLQPGDCVTEQHNSKTIAFEVIAIRQIGRQFLVTFRSILGEASASYHGDAWISAAR